MIKFIVSTIIFACLSSNVYSIDREDIITKIIALNDASLEWLGVSFDALSYLSQTSPQSYVPLSYLESSGKIALVNELNKAGYVEIEKRKGLPDGQETNEMFIRLKPTESGLVVIASVRAQGHNKSMQPTAKASAD